MLTYTSNSKPTTTARREYPWALLLLVFVWLWPGVFSHDLWKPAEPRVYALIVAAIEQNTVLPLYNGSPHFDIAPIYIKTAILFQKLLTPWAAEPFAASRLASVWFSVWGLLGCGMAGYHFLGKHFGRSVVLILIGSVGLLPIGHFLGAQSPVFAGVGLALWGYAIVPRQILFASLLISMACVLLQQAAGLLVVLCVLLAGTLTLLHQPERNSRILFKNAFIYVITAPLLILYPLSIAIFYPDYIKYYLDYFLWGSFGGLSSFNLGWQGFYYIKNSLWFTFPAWPLTLWTLSRNKLLDNRAGVFSVSWLFVFGLFLALNPQANQDLLILILPVLALLGAAQLDNLRRGATAFLNWFGIMIFGAAALFLWLGFIAMNYGFPAKLAARAAYFSPYYVRDIDIMPLIVALIFTPMWIIAINRKHIRGRQAVTNWAAGTTLVWALLMTLFLPWIDAIKSYRPVIIAAQTSLSQDMQNASHDKASCLYINPRYQDALLAWQQYATLPYYRESASCRYQLVQHSVKDNIPKYGKVIWQGRRPRNKNEWFTLLDTQSN